MLADFNLVLVAGLVASLYLLRRRQHRKKHRNFVHRLERLQHAQRHD